MRYARCTRYALCALYALCAVRVVRAMRCAFLLCKHIITAELMLCKFLLDTTYCVLQKKITKLLKNCTKNKAILLYVFVHFN